MTKYHNDNPKRKESGMYKITASNKYGQDTAEVEIIIICKSLLYHAMYKWKEFTNKMTYFS